MDFVIAALAAVCYLMGKYNWAFWILIAAIANGWLAVLKSKADPSWYIVKRMEAGLDPSFDLKGLITVKVIQTIVLGAIAWWLAGLAGYRG